MMSDHITNLKGGRSLVTAWIYIMFRRVNPLIRSLKDMTRRLGRLSQSLKKSIAQFLLIAARQRELHETNSQRTRKIFATELTPNSKIKEVIDQAKQKYPELKKKPEQDPQ